MSVGKQAARSVWTTPYGIWYSPGTNSTQASVNGMGSAWLHLHDLVVIDTFDPAAAESLINDLLSLAEADGRECWGEYLASKENAEEDEEFDPYDRDMYLHRIEEELHNLSLEGDTFVRSNSFVVKTAASYNALLEAMSPAARSFFDGLVMGQKAQEMLEDWKRRRDKASIAWVTPLTGNLLAAYRTGLSRGAEIKAGCGEQVG
jgi:hypothetical protein